MSPCPDYSPFGSGPWTSGQLFILAAVRQQLEPVNSYDAYRSSLVLTVLCALAPLRLLLADTLSPHGSSANLWA